MSLKPVQQVLKSLKQTQWQQEQAFVQLLQAWSQIVGPAVAAQAQPLQITPRKVLLVVVSSSAWAQNLAFERSRILQKLNSQLNPPLTDIRFTTNQWPSSSAKSRHHTVPPAITPAHLVPPSPLQQREPSTNPTEAFDRWTKAVHQRSQGFPACPQCQCPTPITELKRWSVCNLCAVRVDPTAAPYSPSKSVSINPIGTAKTKGKKLG